MIEPLTGNALLAYAAYFIATASPGPSNLSIMSIAMHEGRRAATAFALGVVSGSVFWGLLAALGLSAALASYSQLLIAIKFAGGLYLLWLAWRSARSALSAQPRGAGVADRSTDTFASLYLRGMGLHLTNPKAILAWVAIVSLALPAGASVTQALSIVAGCMLIGLFVFGGYAIVFSAPSARRVYGSIRRALETVLAGVFAFAGIRLLLADR